MDEQMNNVAAEAETEQVVAQEPVAAEPVTPPATPQAPMETGNVNYATFIERFLAVLIDAVIIMIVGVILGTIFGQDSPIAQLLNMLVAMGYYVYMVGTYGATFGKRAMNIKIVKEGGGEQVNYVDAFLREIVGKFISGIVFFVGYLWMLWDPKKQTWHDKIAKTIVIKTK